MRRHPSPPETSRWYGDAVLISNLCECTIVTTSPGWKLWSGRESKIALIVYDRRWMWPEGTRHRSRGDLRTDLTSVAAEAPPGATLVIFHTAVLAYVGEERTDLAKAIAHIRARWISNEAPAFSPCHDEKVKAECPVGQFLLAENKRALAYTDPHGRSIHWLAKPD